MLVRPYVCLFETSVNWNPPISFSKNLATGKNITPGGNSVLPKNGQNGPKMVRLGVFVIYISLQTCYLAKF